MIAKPTRPGVAGRSLLLAAAALTLTLLGAGCFQSEPGDDATVSKQEPLAAADFNWLKDNLWPNDVRVCFTSPDDADLTCVSPDRDDVHDLVRLGVDLQ